MGANFSNAMLTLVNILFDLYLWVLLLRVLLQLVRADFFNPFSQFVWRVTQPLAQPLGAVVPRWRRLDTAGVLLALLFAWLYVMTLYTLFLPRDVGAGTALVYAFWKLVSHLVSLYTLTIFVQALLSWFGPGVSNPAASVLWSLNEPLLRPIRRLLPPIEGLDLSPLVAIILLMVIGQLVPLPFELRRL